MEQEGKSQSDRRYKDSEMHGLFCEWQVIQFFVCEAGAVEVELSKLGCGQNWGMRDLNVKPMILNLILWEVGSHCRHIKMFFGMNRELNFRKTNLSTNVEWITEEGNKGKGSS